MDEIVLKTIQKLKSNSFWFGAAKRASAAKAFIGTHHQEAVEPLLEALRDTNERVRNNARQALCSLMGKARDHICSLWAKGRDETVEDIILKSGYVASSPQNVRYLTALKQEELHILKDADSEGVEILLKLLKDKDAEVVQRAQQVINTLENERGINHLCALWAKGRDETLENIILKSRYVAKDPQELRTLTLLINEMKIDVSVSKDVFGLCVKDTDKRISRGIINHMLENGDENGYMMIWSYIKEQPDTQITEELIKALHEKKWRPEETSERALFYFLAHDLTAYHDIDFEQRHLRVWYETGGKEIRDVIASRIRKSGDVQLLSLFKTERGSRKEKLAHDEVQLQIEIRQKQKHYEELFHLLRNASFEQGKGVISSLRDARWVNPDGHGRELQERLESLFSKETDEKGQSSYADAFYRDFRPMLVGSEDPPGDEAGLLAWAGDKGNFRRRSAAVTILAERKCARLSDIANSAVGDAYWQVRMAAAVAELLQPGALSPANKALLAEDHVYYVQAILKRLSARRSLSAMSPKEIEALHENIAVSDPKQRPQDADNFMELIKGFVQTAEQEYLKILSEFFSTEIVASEEASYEARETDVEVVVVDNNAPQLPQRKQGKHKKRK